MKRALRSMLGSALLAVLLVTMAGCGGAQPRGSEETRPASKDAAAPASKDAAVPASSDSGKAASGTYAIVSGESKASYEVKEVFLIEALNATAIGTTSAIKGELKLKDGALQPSTVEVDVTRLKSDRANRDNQLRSRGLETATYPTATFTVAGVEGGALHLAEGQEASFKLTGKAKIHGVEQDLTWDATAKLEGESLKLTATVEFKMSLFQIEPPNIAGRIRVEDTVKLKVELVAKQ